MIVHDLLVVVPAYNEANYIVGCIDSIRNALEGKGLDFEIVVVDNGSSDQTSVLVEGLGPTVISIDRSTVSRARNVGARSLQSRFLAFIDADVVVTNAWGDAVKNLLNSSTPESLLTGAQYSVRKDAGWIEKNWFSNLKDQHLNGGNIIVSRFAFDNVGGFDEGLSTGEDYDFCIRHASLGAEYLFDRSFEAIHLGYPSGLKGFMRREMWHGEGDFKSLAIFGRSPVALIGFGYVMVLLISVVLILSGLTRWGGLLILMLLLGNFSLAAFRFRGCGLKCLFFNTPLNFLYFLARGFSLFQVMVKAGKQN